MAAELQRELDVRPLPRNKIVCPHASRDSTLALSASEPEEFFRQVDVKDSSVRPRINQSRLGRKADAPRTVQGNEDQR